ncbi:hypothetical protein DFP72DRAFT_1175632 [Ephemerocybe angulata]|uniref:Uncharacterized protein n=1 Tax=Ephemerocybe angulata TaxID=980116 RepID=A0A8H6HHE0_9AGAR|nr:hypothetical protein DFP72DRAFT_1175632 [Tulosesus angulatus]
MADQNMLFANFNQDFSRVGVCISLGTSRGYSITNCDPFGRVYIRRSAGRRGDTVLHVTDRARGRGGPSTVKSSQIVNTKRQSMICELLFPSSVLSVKMDRTSITGSSIGPSTLVELAVSPDRDDDRHSRIHNDFFTLSPSFRFDIGDYDERSTEDGGFSIASTSSPPHTIPESPSTVSILTSAASFSTSLARPLPWQRHHRSPCFHSPSQTRDLALNHASMTLERRIDLVQQQTVELEVKAVDIDAWWDGKDEGVLTSLLRIAKKSPSVLSTKEAEDEMQEVEVKEGPNSTLDSANTTGTYPDSSYSGNTFSHTQRFLNASSDGEVGIGLSLLEDLLGGGGDSGSDDGDEETDKWSRSSSDNSFKKDDASEGGEGTLEGLQYGEDEEDGEGVLDLGFPIRPSTMSVVSSKVATMSTTTTSPPRPVQPHQQSPMSPTFSFTSFHPPHMAIHQTFSVAIPTASSIIGPGAQRDSMTPSSMHRGREAIYDYSYDKYAMGDKDDEYDESTEGGRDGEGKDSMTG